MKRDEEEAIDSTRKKDDIDILPCMIQLLVHFDFYYNRHDDEDLFF
jgi:hypothetical protein